MMKKVCIALDYAPSAQKIAEKGHEHAQLINAEVILVHVIPPNMSYMAGNDPIMGYTNLAPMETFETRAAMAEVAREYLASSVAHLGDPTITSEVLDGDVATAVLDFTDANAIDLLILGSHTHSLLEDMFMGNTAVKIVKHAKIPLLIIPTKE